MSIKRVLLKKLFKHRYIGARHTEIRNAMKGFPPPILNEVRKEIKKANVNDVRMIDCETDFVRLATFFRLKVKRYP